MQIVTGWVLSFLVKLAISFLEAKATAILKKDGPSVVTRLQTVASNVKTYHEQSDFPKQAHQGGV